MKQNVDCTSLENDDSIVSTVSLFFNASPLILPLEDHLVIHLVDYLAFDAQSAFSNLDLN